MRARPINQGGEQPKHTHLGIFNFISLKVGFIQQEKFLKVGKSAISTHRSLVQIWTSKARKLVVGGVIFRRLGRKQGFLNFWDDAMIMKVTVKSRGYFMSRIGKLARNTFKLGNTL